MLFATLVPAVVIGVLSYLMAVRSDTARRTWAGQFVLEYGKALQALPTVVGMLWTVIFAVLVIVEPPKASDVPYILGLLALITVTMAPVVIESRGVAHRVSATGIEKVSPWSAGFTLPWKDVRSVTWDPGLFGFVVAGPQGKIRLSRMLDGLPDFRAALEAHVPIELWEGADPYLPDSKPRR